MRSTHIVRPRAGDRMPLHDSRKARGAGLVWGLSFTANAENESLKAANGKELHIARNQSDSPWLRSAKSRHRATRRPVMTQS